MCATAPRAGRPLDRTDSTEVRRVRRFLCPLLLVALCANATASDVAERLADYFGYCAENGMFNGAVLVKDDGETVYSGAFGIADPTTGEALEVDSAFYLASVSKQFTSMAAMVLAEAGELDLDDPLVKYFPGFEGFADDVRVHHLMQHTSGLPDHYRLLGGVPEGLDNERVRALLVEHGRLDFEPGAEYRYSNGGYVMLSMLVGKAGGASYREVLTERVLEPLGMQHTVVYDKTGPRVEKRAVGFRSGGALDDYTIFTTGAGGMFSTVVDLALWETGLDGLVSEEMLERAYTPPLLTGGGTSDYGFGWIVRNAGGKRLVTHSGGLAAFATYIIRDLGSRDAFIILSNRSDALVDFGELTQSIAMILEGMSPALPRIPISRVLQELIDAEGIDAALARYEEIWTSDATRYDLREGLLNELGYSYVTAGELDIAVAIFARNTESYPRSSNPWDSLAEAQLLKGMKAEALENYRRALELDPGNTNAAAIVARLEAEG